MPEIKISVRHRTKRESVGEVPRLRIRIFSPLLFRPGYLLGAIRNSRQTKEELVNNCQYNKTEKETK